MNCSTGSSALCWSHTRIENAVSAPQQHQLLSLQRGRQWLHHERRVYSRAWHGRGLSSRSRSIVAKASSGGSREEDDRKEPQKDLTQSSEEDADDWRRVRVVTARGKEVFR